MSYREIPITRGDNVDTVSYEDQTGNLRVTFQRSGSPVYIFQQVPGTVADGFTTSGLTGGRYFNMAVKGQFVFDKA